MREEILPSEVLSNRKQAILSCIIGRYIRSASPVGSGQISKSLDQNLSSATIRNEMVRLEEDGYIKRIHASSGAVPSDKGYRCYLSALESDDFRLMHEIDKVVRPEFADLPIDVDTWIRRAATVLSRFIHNVALITTPRTTQTKLKELHLVHLKDMLALVILVYEGANFGRYLVRFNTLDHPEYLQIASNKINGLLSSKRIDEVAESSMEWTPFEKELLDQVKHLVRVHYRQNLGRHHMEGLTRLSAQPEFAGSIGAQQLLAVLEDQDVLSTSLLHNNQLGMRVIIGTENPSQKLRPFTMVVSSYGNATGLMGLLAAVGPTRMDYVRAIGGVRSVSGIMSELVGDL